MKVVPLPIFTRSDLLRLGEAVLPSTIACAGNTLLVGWKGTVAAFGADMDCQGLVTAPYFGQPTELLFVDSWNAVAAVDKESAQVIF